MEQQKGQIKSKKTLWLKRIGIVGFLFFLIKGLIWIGVAMLAYTGFMRRK